MGVVGPDDGLWATVQAAEVMVQFADCWAPATLEISGVMEQGLGGPFTVGEAAAKWYDGAAKLQQAQQTLTESVAAVPRDYWTGADRDRFDTEISNLAAEIGDSHNYANAVAITLTALTVPLAAWPLVCDTIGVVEAANAAAFYAAAASVVGDLGPSEALYAEGEAVTLSCLGVINASAAVITAVMAAGTAAIAISDGADLGAQAGHGNTAALADFGKATIDSSAEVALAAYGAHEPRTPGRHEAGAPRHRAEPRPTSHLKERVKDRIGEQANQHYSTPALKKLADALLPDDAPNPDDETWGAGEPKGSASTPG
jgi:hypothetical protein